MNTYWKKYLGLLLFTILSFGFFWVLHILNKESLSIQTITIVWFGLFLLILSGVLGSPLLKDNKWVLPWYSVGITLLGFVAAVFYLDAHSTVAVWILTVVIGSIFIWVEIIVGSHFRIVWRLLGSFICAGIFGFLLASIWMWETRFSEEEFFVAVQTVLIAISWWFVWMLIILLLKSRKPQRVAPRGVTLNRPIVICTLVILLLADVFWVINRYQASFYPSKEELQSSGEPFYGISAETPFLCAAGTADQTVYDGENLWKRYLKLVEANPQKGAPEFGMLALGTGERSWAVQFHDALMKEVETGDFTEPANSVKIGQYLAALRAYYYPKVSNGFPDLFSQAEQLKIRDWFAKINRRTLTVEWVDWMYSLAFAAPFEGPYENQENGAGLLAMLEKNNLADPSLSQRNQDYLQRNPRGWQIRFRNTDDAITYQPLWINNAFFQSLYTGKTDARNVQQSFEWILDQAPPHGEDLQYNHPDPTSLVGVSYLGAVLLQDGRYLWLAGKGITTLESKGGFLEAQPGIEQPVTFNSQSPQTGNCLLYGDSGLPNQVGPLAPDKVVIRNGWQDNSNYLLMNLRFTGWHRYKATNTITMFYHQQPLVSEVLNGDRVAWLPYGRSHFRDKRIPRENLNGLSIERQGFSQIFYYLTGIGGPWEQDPPFYAQVTTFAQEKSVQHTRTTISNWRGWKQDRDIYTTVDGLVAIVDWINGPSGKKASIFWHINGEELSPGKVQLGSMFTGDRAVFIPSNNNQVTIRHENREPNLDVEYAVPREGSGRFITIFLTGPWAQAEVQIKNNNGMDTLLVSRKDQKIEIPLKDTVIVEDKKP